MRRKYKNFKVIKCHGKEEDNFWGLEISIKVSEEVMEAIDIVLSDNLKKKTDLEKFLAYIDELIKRDMSRLRMASRMDWLEKQLELSRKAKSIAIERLTCEKESLEMDLARSERKREKVAEFLIKKHQLPSYFFEVKPGETVQGKINELRKDKGE